MPTQITYAVNDDRMKNTQIFEHLYDFLKMLAIALEGE